jgi:hypothetical protein
MFKHPSPSVAKISHPTEFGFDQINRHATVLVRTHPTDIASSISLNADDEAREIGATLFRLI